MITLRRASGTDIAGMSWSVDVSGEPVPLVAYRHRQTQAGRRHRGQPRQAHAAQGHAPCPICGEKMTLRGHGDGLFQGCDGHGFWLDADAVPHTGLRRGVDQGKLESKRADQARMEAERKERELAEEERLAQKQAKEQAEVELRRRIEASAELMRPERELQVDGRPLQTIDMHKVAADLRMLYRRIKALESRNAELERRIIDLERARREPDVK